MTRFLLGCSAALFMGACGQSEFHDKRLVVLGIDGMDFALTTRLMQAGRMPHFSRIASHGHFQALETSTPPLSPVAWSDFVTGLDSSGHRIYDFLHRDVETMAPVFSMSYTEPPSSFLELGEWRIPLDGSATVNLRQGEVFWKAIGDADAFTSVIRMPANYPPAGEADRELAGMGTPDLRGTYGVFTFITTKFGAAYRAISGGEIVEVWEENGAIQASLKGPENPFRMPGKESKLSVPLTITRGRSSDSVEVSIDDDALKLNLSKGEFSDWVPIEFDLLGWMPMDKLHGMVRFYLRSVYPELELYVSPVNFDPMHPDGPVSEPAGLARELAEASGRFYTQGMPEDTKALEEEVLNLDEFLLQARVSAADVLGQLESEVELLLDHRRAFLFYYVGHLDQVSHMTWKSMDPMHPAYDAVRDPPIAAQLEQLYIEVDELVGDLAQTLEGEADLIVMSDHGFAPWRREMDLNAWLHAEGYLALKSGTQSEEAFANVDWARTRAYGVGFNGLYINLKGRELAGIVTPDQYQPLLEELGDRLRQTIDPANGEPAVSRVYETPGHFSEQSLEGPDLIVGYAYGTRVSSYSALGGVGDTVFSDHLDAWSGDHAMDHESVPGILLSSQKLPRAVSNLRDLSALIKQEFLTNSR